MQIIVLGMHRSGTSSVTRLINLFGAHVGSPATLIPSADDNRLGFWEQRPVALLNDEILAAADQSWDCVCPPGELAFGKDDQRDKKIRAVIEELEARRPWVLKDPRLSLTLPCWMGSLECPIYVLAVREPLAVAESLRRRNGFPTLVGLALWYRYIAHAHSALQAVPADQLLVVDHRQVSEDPVGFAAALFARLTRRGVTGLRKLGSAEAGKWFRGELVTRPDAAVVSRYAGVIDALRPLHESLARCHLETAAWTVPIDAVHVLDDALVVRAKALESQRAAAAASSALQQVSRERDELERKVAQAAQLASSPAVDGVDMSRVQLQQVFEAISLAQNTYQRLVADCECLIDNYRSQLSSAQASNDRLTESVAAEQRDATDLIAKLRRELHATAEGLATERELHLASRRELEEANVALVRLDACVTERDAATAEASLARQLAAARSVELADALECLRAAQDKLNELATEREAATAEASLARQLAAVISAELANTQEGLRAAQVQLNELATIVDTKSAELEHAATELRDLRAIVDGLRSAADGRTAELAALRAELAVEKARLEDSKTLRGQRESELAQQLRAIRVAHERVVVASKQLLGWLDETIPLQRATFRSMRWRVGNFAGAVVDLLRLRVRPRMARNDLETIAKQYIASRDGVIYAHDDMSNALASLTGEMASEGEWPVCRPQEHAVARAPEVGPSAALRMWRRTAASLSRSIGGLAAAVVLGAKWSVHRTIDALPIGRVRRESLRLRIFDLQQALLTRTPNSAVLADLELLSAHRGLAPGARVPGIGGGQSPVMIDLSLVLYRSQKWLDGFFAALATSSYPLSCINLLVTDHSPDSDCAEEFQRVIDLLSDRFASIRFERAGNKGFGAGHNRNLRYASSEYFFVCNVDGELTSSAIEEVVRAAISSDDDVVAWELRQIPYEHPKYYDPVTLEVSWASGACVMFRAAALRSAGAFEPRIFMYGEDVELSYRLRSRGGRLVYVPKAVMRHETYAEAEEFKPLQFLGSTLSNAYLRLRYGGNEDILAIPGMWLSLLSVVTSKRLMAAWLRTTFKLIKDTPYFLMTREVGGVRLPFSGWDYGMRRTGAFHYCCPPSGGDVPKVSIITRTHGQRHNFLRQAIASVANQTWPNIELIVVEDGGELAAPLCAELAQRTGLDIKHVGAPKRGRCHAGNLGLSAASGEFIGFLDDDDLLFADHVETLALPLMRHRSIGAAYSLSWEVALRIDGSSGKTSEVMHRTVPEHCQPFSRDILAHHNFMPIQAPLFRRTLFEEYGGFDVELENLEDWDLWRRYSYRHDFLYIEKTTSVYHVPADRTIAASRQLLLDEYYQIAKARYARFEQAHKAPVDAEKIPS